ncbi:MAG: hypothetical protein ACXV74_15105 [Methylobacter sp.]
MKSYLRGTDRAVGPNGDSLFLRFMELNYSAHRAGGDSFSLIDIVDFQ